MHVLLPGFKIRDLPGGTLELVVPKRYRTLLFSCAVLSLGVLLVTRAGIYLTIFVPLFTVAAGLINERWYFSRQGEEILHHSGTLFFLRTRRIDLKQIRYVEILELTAATRGILPDPFKRKCTSLSFVTVTESRIDIEIRPDGYRQLLREKGQKIAEHLGKPFIER